MPKTPERTPQHRPTLADQNARYYELLMAYATKPARQGSQTVELAERHAGPKDGQLRLASLSLVQAEDESDVQFQGRIEAVTRAVLEIRDKLNAEIDAEKVGANGEGE